MKAVFKCKAEGELIEYVGSKGVHQRVPNGSTKVYEESWRRAIHVVNRVRKSVLPSVRGPH